MIHRWDVTPKEAISIQKSLNDKLIFKPFNKTPTYVAGVDLSYVNNKSLAVIVVIDSKFNVVEITYHIDKIKYPYIPGLLAFREGPVFLKAWQKIKTNVDLVMFDGHGIAHPRKLGIASHMGLWIKKPTIGIAKKKLVGTYDEPSNTKFSSSYLWYNGEKIGIVLKSRENTKPIFISPGHLIDLDSSLNIVKKYITKYKLPEPTRLAHIYTQKLKNKIIEKE